MSEPHVDTAEAPAKAAGARALSRYLQGGIERGELGPGVKLPAERELSLRFGASRGAVRRVLAGFRARGLITQTVGSGTFVSGHDRIAPTAAGRAPRSVATAMSARLS